MAQDFREEPILHLKDTTFIQEEHVTGEHISQLQTDQSTGLQTAHTEIQLSVEGHLPLVKDVSNKRQSIIAKEAVQKKGLAEQISLERSSPPSFVPEVKCLSCLYSLNVIFSKQIS